jgi:hypothetical protein
LDAGKLLLKGTLAIASTGLIKLADLLAVWSDFCIMVMI